jgi:hypothetical protein
MAAKPVSGMEIILKLAAAEQVPSTDVAPSQVCRSIFNSCANRESSLQLENAEIHLKYCIADRGRHLLIFLGPIIAYPLTVYPQFFTLPVR